MAPAALPVPLPPVGVCEEQLIRVVLFGLEMSVIEVLTGPAALPVPLAPVGA